MPGQLGHNPAVLAFFKSIFQPLFWRTPLLPDPHTEPVLPILQLLPGYFAADQSCLSGKWYPLSRYLVSDTFPPVSYTHLMPALRS